MTIGLAAVLVSPESEDQFSFSAGLWLMPLWLPVPHGPLGNNADPVLGPPSLTLSPGAVSVPVLGQEVHWGVGWGVVQRMHAFRQEETLPWRTHKSGQDRGGTCSP